LKKYASEENYFVSEPLLKNVMSHRGRKWVTLWCFSKQLCYDLKAYNYRLFKDAVNEFEQMWKEQSWLY